MDNSWKPGIDSHEWYSRWAVDTMAPCSGCSPEYREAYAKLQVAVESADQCFRLAYTLYTELSHLSHIEPEHEMVL